MIDIEEFERLEGRELGLKAPEFRDQCDQDFVHYFLHKYAALDPFHFRIAIGIVSRIDSNAIRRELYKFINSLDVEIEAAVSAFFHSQLECGYIDTLPKEYEQ